MKNKYYEKISIKLIAKEAQLCSELCRYLKGRGYKSDDDFYYLDRRDVAKPWQSISIITINVVFENAEVYSAPCDDLDDVNDGYRWDTLNVEYLLATLPVDLVAVCATECESIAMEFALDMYLGDRLLSPGMLLTILSEMAQKLTDEWDEPGSEMLALLIQDQYRR